MVGCHLHYSTMLLVEHALGVQMNYYIYYIYHIDHYINISLALSDGCATINLDSTNVFFKI